MRSPSSRAADRARPARGFTLLEVLLALGLLALIAGVVAVGASRGAAAAGRANTADAVLRALLTTRVEAMRTGSPRSVILERVTGGLRLIAGEGAGFVRTDLVPLGDDGQPAERLEALFDTAGRTRARLWTFAAGGESNTILSFEFDPVSGAPSVLRGPRARAVEPPGAGSGTGRSTDAQ